ncbi:MAG: ParB/RepB/Spo0J family partition protein [Desulfobulbus sp.]|jgi:ParB family chromosome partitioning protein
MAGKGDVLGRGMDALLPDTDQDGEEKLFMCDVDKISPNPNQPRSYFDPDKLSELADSIREKGVLQPLLVARDGSRYTLIAGERRLRAAKMAELETVPVMLVDEAAGSESLELALIENIQRHDLNPIEEALAYTRLLEEFHCTQEEVAKKVGRQRSTVANVLRLLQLPKSVQDDVVQGMISEGHARVLLRFKDDPDRLLEIRNRIVEEALSVRETEQLCAKPAAAEKGPAPERRAPSRPVGELSPEYCASVGIRLGNWLQTRVRVTQQGDRGKLEIEYSSRDDLDRLLALLSQCGPDGDGGGNG